MRMGFIRRLLTRVELVGSSWTRRESVWTREELDTLMWRGGLLVRNVLIREEFVRILRTNLVINQTLLRDKETFLMTKKTDYHSRHRIHNRGHFGGSDKRWGDARDRGRGTYVFEPG